MHQLAQKNQEKMEKLQFIYLVILCLSATVLEQAQGAGYQEVCNGTNIPCFSSITDPLQCTITTAPNGTCTCYDDMIRDTTLNQCVSVHGKECTIAAGDGLPIKECTQFAECWPNPKTAIQSIRENGTCHCDRRDTIPNSLGLCKLNYGSTRCQKETDCDVLRNFICRENKCVCQNEEFQTFDGERCVALVGGSCVVDPPYVAPPCGENMKCNENSTVCECNGADLTPNPDKTCSKGFNKTCDPLKKECHPDFECDPTDKICVCPTSLIPHSDGTCRIKIGGNCQTTNYSCIANAGCNNNICACSADYTASADNTKCLGKYGIPCNDTSPCSESNFLRCTEGSCKCMDRYDNDDTNKICKGWLNSKCPTAGNEGTCVGKMVCGGSNTCQCPTTYVPSGDKECHGTYGADCDIGDICSSGMFLGCTGGKCQCSDPSKYLYEEGKDRCFAMADQVCTGEGQCVTNSTCQGGSPMTCACLAKHKAKEGRCVPGGASSIVASSALVAIVMMAIGEKYY